MILSKIDGTIFKITKKEFKYIIKNKEEIALYVNSLNGYLFLSDIAYIVPEDKFSRILDITN
jgi:hypothetical protein|tara:strand:- start:44 stop:229 length:186 start_codon:yes stop_codon:yes gene_type:complete